MSDGGIHILLFLFFFSISSAGRVALLRRLLEGKRLYASLEELCCRSFAVLGVSVDCLQIRGSLQWLSFLSALNL